MSTDERDGSMRSQLKWRQAVAGTSDESPAAGEEQHRAGTA
jgi:hypothetical protein